MAVAFTRMPDDTIRRYHLDLSECAHDGCTEAHADKARLLAPDPGADRARQFDCGWDADKEAL